MIHILIVEDEKPISNLIRLSLKKAGYDCTCAYDGAEAADILEERRFDLILLDVMLPEIDGFSLMEYIRPMEIPVIFLTAKNAVNDRVRGLELGAEDYLVKPFEFERFKEAVEKHIHRAQLLENKEELSQEELDRLLQTASTAASGPAGSKERAAGGPEKGIQNETLHILLECIRSNPDTLYNCDQLSRECSLSKVTVRRYMNYLIETDLAESIVDYRTGGRPRLLYRCKKDRL